MNKEKHTLIFEVVDNAPEHNYKGSFFKLSVLGMNLYQEKLFLTHFFNWQNLYTKFLFWYFRDPWRDPVTVTIVRRGKELDSGIITDKADFGCPPYVPQLYGLNGLFPDRPDPLKDRYSIYDKYDARYKERSVVETYGMEDAIFNLTFEASEFQVGDIIEVKTRTWSPEQYMKFDQFFGKSKEASMKPSGNEKIYQESGIRALQGIVKHLEHKRNLRYQAWINGYRVIAA